MDTLVYTEAEIRRILHAAFRLAQTRRRRVTSVDKANVLETSRLWRELADSVAEDYPDVSLEHMLVDNAAMQLIRSPSQFDVIVTENTFGDILTDEAAVLSGSMGMLPSASLGHTGGETPLGLYEPIHGSAPDIAGRGIANPVGRHSQRRPAAAPLSWLGAGGSCPGRRRDPRSGRRLPHRRHHPPRRNASLDRSHGRRRDRANCKSSLTSR